MPDISTLLILLTLTNKNGFNSIKHAIETADNFSNKIQSLSNIMNVLPSLSSLIGSSQNGGLANLLSGFIGANGTQNIFNSAFSQKENYPDSNSHNENCQTCAQNVQADFSPSERYVDTIGENLSRLNLK